METAAERIAAGRFDEPVIDKSAGRARSARARVRPDAAAPLAAGARAAGVHRQRLPRAPDTALLAARLPRAHDRRRAGRSDPPRVSRDDAGAGRPATAARGGPARPDAPRRGPDAHRASADRSRASSQSDLCDEFRAIAWPPDTSSTWTQAKHGRSATRSGSSDRPGAAGERDQAHAVGHRVSVARSAARSPSRRGPGHSGRVRGPCLRALLPRGRDARVRQRSRPRDRAGARRGDGRHARARVGRRAHDIHAPAAPAPAPSCFPGKRAVG